MRRKPYYIAILLVAAAGIFLSMYSGWKDKEAGLQKINGHAYWIKERGIDFSNGKYRMTAGFNKTQSVKGQYWSPYQPRAALVFSFNVINKSNSIASPFEMFGELEVRQGKERLALAAVAGGVNSQSGFWEDGIGIAADLPRKKEYELAYLLKDRETAITISIQSADKKQAIELAQIPIEENRDLDKSQDFKQTEYIAEQQKKEDQEQHELTGGTYLVGSQIEPGEYLIIGEADRITPHVLNGGAGEFDVADGAAKRTYIKVKKGQWLSFWGKAILEEKALPYQGTSYGTGMYKVGKDITPGDYWVTGKQGNFSPKVEILSHVNANQFQRIGACQYLDVGETRKITIEQGTYLKLSDCIIKP